MIVIEGLIGVGKSTLCKKLSEHIEGSIVYYEPVDHPYLPLFYKDMHRWGLEMQFFLMANRYKMHQDAIQKEWSQGIQTIHDRSIWGDKAFAQMLYRDGIINELGYKTYMLHRECMLSQLLVPQVVIWLEADPELCRKRICARERICETGITIEYLRNLRKSYEDILLELKNKGSNVIYYDWNNILQIDQVLSDLNKLVKETMIFTFNDYYRIPISTIGVKNS